MLTAISIGECMVELRQVAGGYLKRSFAGDAFNTAVYLKRCAPEIDVSFLTATGSDALSDALIEHLRSEGLNDRLVFRVSGKRPALYMIETNPSGDRVFHYWRTGTPARQWLKLLLHAGGLDVLNSADLVYVSGISLAILSQQDRRAAIRLLSSLTTKLAFDPNIRTALWQSMLEARRTFEALVPFAAIVLPSRQDYQLMYGIDDPDQQIRFATQMTGGEIALTCDKDGCRLRINGDITALSVHAVQVVDTSGAGDSFNGAYLAARLRGRTPLEAAEDGLNLASQVVAQPGAIIPKLSEERAPQLG